MITEHHIRELLELQVATNVAYFGEEWKTVWTPVAVNNSIYREWAEFLDEVTKDWKVYAPVKLFERVNAVYELVDVVHFMLCRLLRNTRLERQLTDYWPPAPMEDHNVDLERTTERFNLFMYNPSVLSFAYFLTAACNYLKLDFETYMKAHKRKNERNRARAAGGVLQGKYDKSAEQPLTLEF